MKLIRFLIAFLVATLLLAAPPVIPNTTAPQFRTAINDAFAQTYQDLKADVSRAYNDLSPHGQCRFVYTDSTHCTLQRFNGRYLVVGGAQQIIPAAGVSFEAANLTSGKIYYAYIYMDGSIMRGEWSTTGHKTDSGTGVETKTGDVARTLVGMVYLRSDNTFEDSDSARLVASLFNRRIRGLRKAFTTYRSVKPAGNNTWTEIHSEIRVQFLTWGDNSETPASFYACYSLGQTDTWAYITMKFDDTVCPWTTFFTSKTDIKSDSIANTMILSEGYHWATLVFKYDSGKDKDATFLPQTVISIAPSI